MWGNPKRNHGEVLDTIITRNCSQKAAKVILQRPQIWKSPGRACAPPGPPRTSQLLHLWCKLPINLALLQHWFYLTGKELCLPWKSTGQLFKDLKDANVSYVTLNTAQDTKTKRLKLVWMLSWSDQNLPCTLYTLKINCADLRFQILHFYLENMSVTKKI